MDLKELRELLESDIETRIMPKSNYPYIPASAIRERLNLAFNCLWSTEILDSKIVNDDTVVVKLKLLAHIGDFVICKEDFGSAVIHKYIKGPNEGKYTNIGDSYSNAVFDAIKSCAKSMGVGNKDMDVFKDNKGNYVRHCDTKKVTPKAASPTPKAPAPTPKVAAPAPIPKVAAPAPKGPVAAPVPIPKVAAPAPKGPVAAPAPTPKVAAPAPKGPVAAPAPTPKAPAPKGPVAAPAPTPKAPAPIPKAAVPEAYQCPAGGKFGDDNDSFSNCDNCAIYNDCCKTFISNQ